MVVENLMIVVTHELDSFTAGGKIKARVVSKGLNLRYPNTRINLWGDNLHAPMAERILELPMDVYQGEFAFTVTTRFRRFLFYVLSN